MGGHAIIILEQYNRPRKMTDTTPDIPERPTVADKASLLKGETIYTISSSQGPDSAGKLAAKYHQHTALAQADAGGATVTVLNGDMRREILEGRANREKFIAEHGIVPTDTPSVSAGPIPEGGAELVNLETRSDSPNAGVTRHGSASAGNASEVINRTREAKVSLATEMMTGERRVHIPLSDSRYVDLTFEDLSTTIRDHPALKEVLAKNPTYISVVDICRNEHGVVETRMGRIDAKHFDKNFMDVLHDDTHLKNEPLGFRERVSAMTGAEKGIAAMNGVLAAVFLYQAVDHFRHAQEEDPVTGEKKKSWDNITWGVISASLSALAGGLAFSAVKGGSVR